MEMKIINNEHNQFEPQIVAYIEDNKYSEQYGELVGEVVYSQREFDRLTNYLESEDKGVPELGKIQQYVSGPLSEAISLTNIATVGELASKLETN